MSSADTAAPPTPQPAAGLRLRDPPTLVSARPRVEQDESLDDFQIDVDGHNHAYSQRSPLDWADEPPPKDITASTGSPNERVKSYSEGPKSHTSPNVGFERLATRSIHLLNLPDEAEHSDITAAVRGGLLLEVYMRNRDKTAIVSFVLGEDAKAF